MTIKKTPQQAMEVRRALEAKPLTSSEFGIQGISRDVPAFPTDRSIAWEDENGDERVYHPKGSATPDAIQGTLFPVESIVSYRNSRNRNDAMASHVFEDQSVGPNAMDSVRFRPLNRFRIHSRWGSPDSSSHKPHEKLMYSAIQSSAMPNELIKAVGGVFTSEPKSGEVSGAYRPGKDTVVLADTAQTGIPATPVHELGHRADFRTGSDMVEHPWSIRRTPYGVYGAHNTSPVLEGNANGVVERYFDGLRASNAYNDPRYWDDLDRAIYTGTKAHAAATGELFGEKRPLTQVSGPPLSIGDSVRGEYLHHLVMASPHARAALRRDRAASKAAGKAIGKWLSTRVVSEQPTLPGLDGPTLKGYSFRSEHGQSGLTHLGDQF